MEKPLKICVVGKGGVGKSTLTSLMTKILVLTHKYKLLLIDADPTHPHLCEMVKLFPKKSLEKIRSELVKSASNKEKEPEKIAESIDFDVYNAIGENKDFCMYSIGQPEGPGCFCPSNALLRKVIESITKDFDIVLIDCEAGLEQINRMVFKSIDIVLIVTDMSMRSLETALAIKTSADKFIKYKKIGVVLNKVKGDVKSIEKKLAASKMDILERIPEDEKVEEFDKNGAPTIDLPLQSSSVVATKNLIAKIIEM